MTVVPACVVSFNYLVTNFCLFFQWCMLTLIAKKPRPKQKPLKLAKIFWDFSRVTPLKNTWNCHNRKHVIRIKDVFHDSGVSSRKSPYQPQMVVVWWTMSISWQLATFASSYVAEKFSAVNLECTRCASRHKLWLVGDKSLRIYYLSTNPLRVLRVRGVPKNSSEQKK